MSDKHTKKELFTTLLVFASAAEADSWVIKGIEHELDLLTKRAGAKGADMKKKAAQRKVKDEILVALTKSNGDALRVTAIAAEVGTSPQQVTALIKQMVDDDEVVRAELKKVAFFSLPEDDEE